VADPRSAPTLLREALAVAAISVVALGGSAAIGATPDAGAASTTTTAPAEVAPTAVTPSRDAYVFTLRSGGRTRSYRLHVPPAASSGRHLPLVLNLHGATQNAQLQEIQSGMDASSDRDGYLVAYPDGTRIATKLDPDPVAKDAQYGFNAGACCGLPVAKHVDDVRFLESVITDVARHTPVDRRRVYVTGMSNGGMMAYTMAAKASRQVAAIASVSGQVQLPTIHPSRAVPTLEFHSIDDPIAKWRGVPNHDPRLRFSVPAGVAQWVKADGCRAKPRQGPTRRGATGSENAGLTATLLTYRGCRAGAEVALWKLTGSGHVWPGAPFNLGPRATWVLDGVGHGTTLVDANEQMWAFFRRFALPAK
jgi:polyhydroxybutyrate depolymerase